MVKPATEQGGLTPDAVGVPDAVGAPDEVETIDPARFAREGAHLGGRLGAARLPRLAEQLFDQEGTVDYSLDGMISANGDPALRVGLTIAVAVACNRCMERLPLKLDAIRTLIFSQGLSELDALDDEDDEVDQVPLLARLDVLDLIDQEVMLSLPIAPRHAEAVCAARIDNEPDAQPPSPFSVLSKLKRT